LDEYLAANPTVYPQCVKPTITPADRLGMADTYGLFIILLGAYFVACIWFGILKTPFYKKF